MGRYTSSATAKLVEKHWSHRSQRRRGQRGCVGFHSEFPYDRRENPPTISAGGFHLSEFRVEHPIVVRHHAIVHGFLDGFVGAIQIAIAVTHFVTAAGVVLAHFKSPFRDTAQRPRANFAPREWRRPYRA
jgi:hypothetical protein